MGVIRNIIKLYDNFYRDAYRCYLISGFLLSDATLLLKINVLNILMEILKNILFI